MKRIFLLVFFIGGFGVLFLGLNTLKKSQDAKNWPTINGKVISSAVKSSWSDNKRMYSGKVKYQYKVNGRTYTSDKVSFGEYSSSDSRDAEKVINKYRLGMESLVYYNPRDPALAILEPAATRGIYIPIFIGIIFILFGLMFYIKESVNGKRLRLLHKKINPEDLDDDVAKMTIWTPLVRGGANFQTQKLVNLPPYRMEFRATTQANLFVLIFFSLGLAVFIIFLGTNIMPILVGAVFMFTGIYLFININRPVTFDKMDGYFLKGGKPIWLGAAIGQKGCFTKIADIYALQIVSESCSGSNNSSFFSYELNLVLKDGSRFNITDHGNLEQLRDDADVLSKFLSKPIWDVV